MHQTSVPVQFEHSTSWYCICDNTGPCTRKGRSYVACSLILNYPLSLLDLRNVYGTVIRTCTTFASLSFRKQIMHQRTVCIFCLVPICYLLLWPNYAILQANWPLLAPYFALLAYYRNVPLGTSLTFTARTLNPHPWGFAMVLPTTCQVEMHYRNALYSPHTRVLEIY
jgi:hypothetical protein